LAAAQNDVRKLAFIAAYRNLGVPGSDYLFVDANDGPGPSVFE